MDGLPRLGWGDALHRGNVLHFHPQHIPGMDAAGLCWGQRGNGLIEPPEQFGIFGLRLLFHQAILRRWLRPADGGIFDSVVTIEGVKRLIAEHLAFPGGLGSLIPVSYTHLDVYKRQHRRLNICEKARATKKL